jgi:hypothetical protein
MNVRADMALRRLRRLVIAGLAGALLSSTAVAAASTKLVSPEVVASYVAGKPIVVTISPAGPGTWSGAALVGGDQVFLGEEAYRDAEQGGGVGLFLLLHETGHTTGIADEHAADCFSLAHIKGVLRDFWQLRPTAIAARYADALSWPGKYDGNRCSTTRSRRGR